MDGAGGNCCVARYLNSNIHNLKHVQRIAVAIGKIEKIASEFRLRQLRYRLLDCFDVLAGS